MIISMKYRFTIFFFLFPVIACAQPFSYQISREVTGDAEQIFEIAERWISESFDITQTDIRVRDRERGRIEARISHDLPLGRPGDIVNVLIYLKLEIADGMVRLEGSDAVIKDDNTEGVPVQDSDSMQSLSNFLDSLFREFVSFVRMEITEPQ